MFNVWTSDGDLDFAKEAWGHLEKAGLTDDSGVAGRTETILRLIALCRIYREFCARQRDENPDPPIRYLAEDLDIDPLSLGLLAAPNMLDDDWKFEEAFQLEEIALIRATGALCPDILDCLRRVYGGKKSLYLRLCQTRSNHLESDAEDLAITDFNLDAYEFVSHGYMR
jgi:hypothetical protein